MKRTNEPLNINTKTYWNGVYGDEHKRSEYGSAGTADVVSNAQYKMTDKTKRFSRAVVESKSGDKVIDFGCGVGNFTTLVKKTYPDCEVWGTDISDAVIEANKQEFPGIKYIHQYIGSQTEVPNNYFDLVFCGETIEHLEKPELAFQDAYKALKTGGKLIITTPLRDSIISNEHVWLFEKDDVEKFYLENGFKDVKFIDLPDMEHLFVIFGIGIKK